MSDKLESPQEPDKESESQSLSGAPDIKKSPLYARTRARTGEALDPHDIIKRRLATQYTRCLEDLQTKGRFLDETGKSRDGDAKLPSLDETIDSFTPEDLAVAGDYKDPVLLLIPENSFVAKVKALNGMNVLTGTEPIYARTDSHSVSAWDDAVIVDDSAAKGASSPELDKITGWRAVIIKNTPEEEDEGTRTNLALGKRAEKLKDARKPGEKGMNRHIVAILAIRNNNMSANNSSGSNVLLDGERIKSESAKNDSAEYMLCANLRNDNEIHFDFLTTGLKDKKAVFFKFVGGSKVLIGKNDDEIDSEDNQ
jgi:hypothetical protein